MIQILVFVGLVLLVSAILIIKSIKYDKQKEILLNHAINGDIGISNLQSYNDPKTYAITYFDGDSIKTDIISATNSIEASYMFCYDNGHSHFKIRRIQRV